MIGAVFLVFWSKIHCRTLRTGLENRATIWWILVTFSVSDVQTEIAVMVLSSIPVYCHHLVIVIVIVLLVLPATSHLLVSPVILSAAGVMIMYLLLKQII